MSFPTKQVFTSLLNVNKETVRRWCRNGEMEGIMRSKKEGLVISSESLLRFLEEHPKYKNLCGEI
jgi:DNA-binding transcriptional regulator YiaG